MKNNMIKKIKNIFFSILRILLLIFFSILLIVGLFGKVEGANGQSVSALKAEPFFAIISAAAIVFIIIRMQKSKKQRKERSQNTVKKIQKIKKETNKDHISIEVESHAITNSETIYYNRIYEEDKSKGVNYEKQSKIVSIFTRKWYEACAKDFIVLDFETTGLDKVYDRIIEVAAVRYVNGEEAEKYVTLVNPNRRIPQEATDINHITQRMVSSAPTEHIVIPKLIDFLGNSLLVGHNVNFDVVFLEIAARRQGLNVKYHYIDTISIAKKILPGLPNYKLGTVAGSLGIKNQNLHRAESDARICAEIVKITLDTLSGDFNTISKEMKATPQPLSDSYKEAEAELLRNQHTPNPRLKQVNGDLTLFLSSRLCPYCSIYNHRIFSISGKDKRFPWLQKLPQNLKVMNCPECAVSIVFLPYLDFNIDNRLQEDIASSNRPFVDSRTDEEKELYRQEKERKIQDTQNRLNYQWLLTNLPELAPKSFSAYVRMRNAKTEKFLFICSKAADAGYIIK